MLERAWAEINLENLDHNIKKINNLCPKSEVYAITKANAYGHGSIPITKALSSKVSNFGVACLSEALELRGHDINDDILILSTCLASERNQIIDNDFQPTVSSLLEARAWSELAIRKNKSLKIHLKIDTGMGRAGFPIEEWNDSTLLELVDLKGLEIQGIMSHFPVADEDVDFTSAQTDNFSSLVKKASSLGLISKHTHIANSAGILNNRESHLSAVRPGLLLYGISPIKEFQENFKPVLSLKSHILDIRTLSANHGISYGSTYTTNSKTNIASIGIGYGDGYPRSVSNQGGHVISGVNILPILGRITMDQILVDVTNTKVNIGDEVILIGKNEHHEILASDVATWAQTIPWEIFTGITPRVIRKLLPY